MSKKKTRRSPQRGRPRAASTRERPRKGPAPRPARKPRPRGRQKGLRANRPLILGLAALAIVAAAMLGLLLARRGSGPKPQATPVRSWSAPPAMAIAPNKQYTATISTAKGDIKIRLFADRAPKTVNNFVFLARQGYYDGTTFHRVMLDFMAQGGDPTGTGRGSPGYTFADEIDPSLKFDKPGLLAMANSGANTNGSQFFITYVPTPWLDGKHTIFGQVEAGMDVLAKLTPRDPAAAAAPPGDRIRTIQITEG